MDSEKSLAREYLEALLIAVVFATFARTWIVQAFKIPSGSMEQNLLIGDHILVNKFVYGPTASELERKILPVRDIRRGDIVVFKFPEDPTRDFIKRCMALPGDTIVSEEKVLSINGREVDDSGYVFHTDPEILSRRDYFQRGARDTFGPEVVPKGQYFCMGDNRDNSNDSRFWGPVPRENVKGRAFMIYWSYASDEPYEWPGVTSKLRQIGRMLSTFFTKTRWERTFRVVR
ncbi:MAG TPA: signal peptidase I [Thermoanaerobaculia bacterium]|nr:signal peptidase I [Thermoanaerobaculia bacterium]